MISPTAGPADIESELADLSGTRLSALFDIAEKELEPTVRRVLRRADDPEGITTGYQPQRLD